MATVEVTSWAEFVEAAGTSGADVVLPENAVWDMNEIQPHFNQNLSISCASVTGNGTEIKNLHITGYIGINGTAVTGLKMTNILADGSGGGSDVYKKGLIYGSGFPVLDQCVFSGIAGGWYYYMLACPGNRNITLQYCAFNLDMQGGNGVQYEGYHKMKASRVFLSLPTMSGTVRLANHSDTGTNMNNEYVINAPLASSVAFDANPSCTLRGNLQNVTSIHFDTSNNVSVYNAEDAPNASVSGNSAARLIGVTDEQMKSAAYLQSIGFVIAGA